MKFGRIVLQASIDAYRPSRIFDLTSHFQDGGHDMQKSAAIW